MPEIQVDWHSQEEADRLRDLRDRHGLVWRGVLLEGAKHVESIDLFKALLELHPELATLLPAQRGATNSKRTAVMEELREQILQRQQARSTTSLPRSAFTNLDIPADATDSDDRTGDDKGDEAVVDEQHASLPRGRTGKEGRTQSIDVASAVAQMQQARATPNTAPPGRKERARTHEDEYWHGAGARAVDADDDSILRHPGDTHDTAEDSLQYYEDDADIVDPRYDEENDEDEYGGGYV
ncbi:hypothetical protein EFA46_015460 (plasmid) [Halarchaeum sp. CBA1220]|uniref:hypothetical protein n=1 Tax=Halarchaeum sp. CBA1220 TaxID=1853682 RepID=UPI000F3A9350|nr:hypothetical protein [Halarchaeum sp. CBA1220]QLC35656.1 hypothetical protein EFA46_015460 [Halarchaeum sp. CBA1220]